MASEKTCQQYLAENLNAMDDIEARQKKRTHRFHIALWVWLVFMIVSFVASWIISGQRVALGRATLQNALKEDQPLFDEQILNDIDVLANRQAASDYMALLMGNSSNHLMMNGIVYQDEALFIRVEDQQCKLTDADGEQTLVPEMISYINVRGNDIFYRDDVSRQLKCLHLSSKQTETISSIHCGEVLCYRDTLYFISLDDGRALYTYDLLGGTTQKVLAEPVLHFGIMAERLYTLSEKGMLTCRLLSDLTKQTFQIAGIGNFSLAEQLYIENDGRIFSLQLDGSRTKEIISQAVQLIGVDDGSIFFVRGNDLLIYDPESKKEACLTSDFVVCLGAFKLDEHRCLLSLVPNDKDQQVTTMVVEVPHAD